MLVSQLVTRSLRLAGVTPHNRAPSAAEMNDGVSLLNEMLNSWAIDGLDLGWVDVEQTDIVRVDDAYLKGIKYCLAVDIAGEHGLEDILSAITIQVALSEKENIRSSLFEVDNLRIDNALLHGNTGFSFTNG